MEDGEETEAERKRREERKKERRKRRKERKRRWDRLGKQEWDGRQEKRGRRIERGKEGGGRRRGYSTLSNVKSMPSVGKVQNKCLFTDRAVACPTLVLEWLTGNL